MEQDRSKTGPKPKQLKPFTRYGIEVGRGDRKTIVDPEEVRKLAAIGMKSSEIAEWFGVDDSTLKYNFKQELVKGQLELKMSLRRAQLKTALAGNPTLLVWLGKNLLGQSDNPVNTEDTKPLPWNSDESDIEIEEYTDEEIEDGVQTTSSKTDG